MNNRGRADSDSSWDNLTHSQVAETDATSTARSTTKATQEQFAAVDTLRKKFKESRKVHATVPLHLGTLSAE